MAFVVNPDLNDVDLLAGKNHALISDEADALGVGSVSLGAGELADRGEVSDDSGGCAVEEASDVSKFAEVVAIEPDVTAEGLEHLVEEFAGRAGR